MKTKKQTAKLQLIEAYFIQFLQCLKRLRKKFTTYIHKYKLQDENDYHVMNLTCGIYVLQSLQLQLSLPGIINQREKYLHEKVPSDLVAVYAIT